MKAREAAPLSMLRLQKLQMDKKKKKKGGGGSLNENILLSDREIYPGMIFIDIKSRKHYRFKAKSSFHVPSHTSSYYP